MTTAIRFTLIAAGILFLVVGVYHRLQSQRSGERLNRGLEGWPLMIAIRAFGLGTFGSAAVWLWKPAWFQWASQETPEWLRWVGVAGYLGAVLWLIWMFRTLGTNLTDTVTVRRKAHFVERGPYRIVRNPMYTGILMVGIALGLALGTWLIPFAAVFMFTLLAVRTRIEEKYLIERFGDRYRDYMRRVGRFFPRGV